MITEIWIRPKYFNDNMTKTVFFSNNDGVYYFNVIINFPNGRYGHFRNYIKKDYNDSHDLLKFEE